VENVENILRWAKRTDKSQDPLEYYNRYYLGLTRGKLATLDYSLYKRLWKDRLLGEVPIKNTNFGGNPLEYYQKHHVGMIRGKLRVENHSLYQRLRRDNLLDNVPLKQNKSR